MKTTHLSFKIAVSGAEGTKSSKTDPVTFFVNDTIAVDCGHLFSEMVNLSKVKHVLLTHCHFDHLQDLPFFIDHIPFDKNREEKIKIYGNSQVIETLQKHIFNQIVWPSLDKFKLFNKDEPAVSLIEIKPFEPFKIEKITVIPIPSNHTVKTNGYAFIKEDKGFLISGDTYKNPALWKFIEKEKRIRKIFVDVSYPSNMEEIAALAKHYTVKSLLEDFKDNCSREDVEILIYHLKYPFIEQIEKEALLANIEVIKSKNIIFI